MTEQCYNKGCGQKFDLTQNEGDICQYHPGAPVFHDATKKWSCCGKWSTDFSEFLSIKGCTKGPHSNVKPVVPENDNKCQVEVEIKEQKMPEPITKEEKVRPDENEAKIPLKVTVTTSAKTALEKKLAALQIQQEEAPQNGDVETAIRPGAPCKHNGCKAKYSADEDSGKCCFHPGYPVFHEGCKFWSCCNIKRTDFSDFLSQPGCATASHVWTTREDEKKKLVDCRHDFFQTGNTMTINIYAKAPVPDLCIVNVNQVAVDMDITFEGGECNFKKNIILAGTIDPARSSVKLIGTKMEITLRKAEIVSWKSLEL